MNQPDLDEIVDEIYKIKRLALPYMQERAELSEIKYKFFSKLMQRYRIELRDRLHRNLEYLHSRTKVRMTPSNIREFMGISIPDELENLLLARSNELPLNYLPSILTIGMFYGIDPTLLLSEDLATLEDVEIKNPVYGIEKPKSII